MQHSSTSAVPFVEKYRPRNLADVVFQDEIVKALKSSLESGNLPHLLFYGPPGTGKTSTILALARELYGPELFHTRVLDLNASDERGIDVIRTKVKNFAQLSVGAKPTGYPYPCPPFKLIVLDEADSMTPDAQAALRRTMETFSKVTRFCIICNYVSRIIEPITSRCAKFRFMPLDQSTLKQRLQYICEKEAIGFSENVIDTIIKLSEGDLRKAITLLQSTARMHGSSGTTTSSSNVIETAGALPDSQIEGLYQASQSNVFETMQQAVIDVVHSGYSATQVLSQLHDLVMNRADLTDLQKSRIFMEMAQTDFALNDGADEFLQLLNICATVLRISNATTP